MKAFYLFSKVATLSLALVGLGIGQVHASLLSNAVALQAVSAISTSNYGGSFPVDKTIDQSDLSGHYVSGVTAASVIDTFTNLNSAKGWHGAAGNITGNITFDLGAQYTLDRIYLFWMNNGLANNIANFTVQVSENNTFSNALTVASFGLPNASKNRVDFNTSATGEFVRLNWTSLQGGYPGLNEFVAGGVSAVPVPGAIWLMISGLIGVLGLNRRKSTTI
ncbi:discoidin domain-containing protein [Methylobacter psychrophilus]|uniref:discoidin domain-containing protein n=1 Tax=Methylobacter psychrophilus TaxID=96941 RepID=UPI0021D4D94A|nr:discoidin domain-containing protein [Methylobacter psychrophilus]